ncbi:MAG: lamin tail domain-containing protein, partial [Nanoarchaeota archaeon]|nr:lamin tail domain-containing protein [Nanoarchaeota archaeon]MBU1051582.1 lamin tail domain-containing protein [Nanoarchaeota archaeon]
MYNSGVDEVDLTGWTLDLIDGTNETHALSGIIPADEYLIILDPSGQQNNNGQLILYDNYGTLIDSVTYGNYDDGDLSDNAPDGNADDITNECLARYPNGVDTDVDVDDFIKTECTFNSANSEQEEPECLVDSDCGEDVVSEPFCTEGDVYQTETSYSCVEEMCESEEENVLIEECEFGCEDGECLPEPSQGLTIFSPVQDAVYTNRIILLDVLYGENARDLRYSDNGQGFKILCKECNTYDQTKQVTEGFHELIFRAINDNGEETVETVSFLVDIRDPKIRSTSPVRGFASGLFMVKFREMNPASLFLNYGII